MVVEPPAVAVQRYQRDAPPLLLAWLGSPVSLVAPTFEPVAVPVAPVIACAFAKLSSAGAAVLLALAPVAHAHASASATSPVPHRNLTDRL